MAELILTEEAGIPPGVDWETSWGAVVRNHSLATIGVVSVAEALGVRLTALKAALKARSIARGIRRICPVAGTQVQPIWLKRLVLLIFGSSAPKLFKFDAFRTVRVFRTHCAVTVVTVVTVVVVVAVLGEY